MKVRETGDVADQDWLTLRAEFIPELPPAEQQAFLREFASHAAGFRAFIATGDLDQPRGFAEVAVRSDYVNGCKHRPVLYLEGIYVRPQYRGRGIARALCQAAERWGRQQGCREFASDVYIDDEDSLAAHAGLGFEEIERVVCLRKLITD